MAEPKEGETPKPEGETPEGSTEAEKQPKAVTVEELQAENERLAKALKETNKEAAARRKKLDQYEQAEQIKAEADKTELQKAQDRAAKAEASAQALKVSLMRRDAAVKVGLPEALVDRLKGETPEELEADAKALLESLPKGEVKPKAKEFNPTNPAGGSKTETKAEQRQRLFGEPIDPFNKDWVLEHGGGVRIPPFDEFTKGGQ